MSPGDKQFVCPPGDKHFSHTGEGGGTNNFDIWRGGQTFLPHRGGQTFYVEDVGGDDDVDGEEEDVSEANILVSEASKLSAGARIFRGP